MKRRGENYKSRKKAMTVHMDGARDLSGRARRVAVLWWWGGGAMAMGREWLRNQVVSQWA
jgi:hypothetical protein